MLSVFITRSLRRAVEDDDKDEQVEEINPQQAGRGGGGGAPGGSYIRGLEPLPARGGPGVSSVCIQGQGIKIFAAARGLYGAQRGRPWQCCCWLVLLR